MTKWTNVEQRGEKRPALLERGENVVVQRRNLHRSGENWAFEQRSFSEQEWDEMNSPAVQAMMQAISELELNAAELAVMGRERA